MPKTRILLASVLKPVTDTRMFGKLGNTLAKLPGVTIYLAGQAATLPATNANISFIPLFHFSRLSFGRLSAQWKYYQTLLKVKPEVIIITTPELLPVTILYSVLFNADIFYDIQENYFKNITQQPTYPKLLRPLLGYSLRFLEKITHRFIIHYFLAERSYAQELTFLEENYTILENKFEPEKEGSSDKEFPVKLNPVSVLNFLYSGTISDIYGIWEAIDLVSKLHDLNSHIHLTIIGFCPQQSIYDKLVKVISEKPFITLIGGNLLVPHPEIVKEIRKAAVGLLPYRYNPSTADCMPTKLFEYLANGLPVLIPENPLWGTLVRKSKAGFSIDFQNPDYSVILNRLIAETFYPNGIPQDVFWQEEANKLLAVFKDSEHIKS